jgi:hypothetical protein
MPHQVGQGAEPVQAAALEGPAVQGREHPFQGVVAGKAAGQLQEAPEPRLALLGELGDVRPVIAVTDHSANRHDHDVD